MRNKRPSYEDKIARLEDESLRRERIATEVLGHIISSSKHKPTPRQAADEAVIFASALIRSLKERDAVSYRTHLIHKRD